MACVLDVPDFAENLAYVVALAAEGETDLWSTFTFRPIRSSPCVLLFGRCDLVEGEDDVADKRVPCDEEVCTRWAPPTIAVTTDTEQGATGQRGHLYVILVDMFEREQVSAGFRGVRSLYDHEVDRGCGGDEGESP